MSAKPHPTPESHPLVFRLAREIGAPLSFFDTESTSLGHQKPTFGFTEIAFFSAFPDGKGYAFTKMVNPENTIEARASQITGITQAMVDSEQNFAACAEKIHRMMEKSIPIGYNSASFDIPAMLGQFDRYGLARPAHSRNVDLRHMWKTAQNTDKGTQSEVAEHYGVPFSGAHRALEDVLALPDILERMLWKHGADLFHGSMRHDWDGPAASAKARSSSGPSAPRTPKGELTANQALLKATIDEALAAGATVEAFKAALASKGFALEVTKFGGSRYFFGPAGSAQEKTNGSDLGSDYSWKAVRAKLTGDIPADMAGTAPAPQDKDSRAAEEAKAKAAILAQIEQGAARVDMAKAAADSEASPRTVSFALTAMLAEGSVQASHVREDAAQAWLESNWATLPTSGNLTPLLDACRKAGAPETVDFIQLRVIKASKGAGMPAAAPRAQRPAAAPAPQPQRQAYSRPPAAPAPAPAPVHDDIPPFDDDFPPTASRNAP